MTRKGMMGRRFISRDTI